MPDPADPAEADPVNPPVNAPVKQELPSSPGIVKRTQIKAPKGTGAVNPKDHEKKLRDLETKTSVLEDRVDGLEGAFNEINSMFERQQQQRGAAPAVGLGDIDKEIWE